MTPSPSACFPNCRASGPGLRGAFELPGLSSSWPGVCWLWVHLQPSAQGCPLSPGSSSACSRSTRGGPRTEEKGGGKKGRGINSTLNGCARSVLKLLRLQCIAGFDPFEFKGLSATVPCVLCIMYGLSEGRGSENPHRLGTGLCPWPWQQKQELALSPLIVTLGRKTDSLHACFSHKICLPHDCFSLFLFPS